MRNVSIRQLRAFQAVAHHGSFVLAAKSLFITQSALSGSIKQLEESLGVRLFDRTTRLNGLTHAGRLFLEDVRMGLGSLEQGIRRMDELASLRDGQVAIAAAPSVLAAIVLPCVSELRHTYPGLRVTLREEGADAIIRCVREGEVDFGIGGWHPSATQMNALPLLTDSLGIVGPSAHPLFTRKTLRASDIATATFIGLTTDTAISQMIAAEPTFPDSVRDPSLRVSNPWLMQQAIKDGLGLGVIPALIAQHADFDGLTFRTLDQPKLAREIMLFRSSSRSLSTAATLYCDALIRNAHAYSIACA